MTISKVESMDAVKTVCDPIIEFYKNLHQGRDFVPLHEPCFIGKEQQYVLDCVTSGWVSSVGSYVDTIQNKLQEISGASFAVPTVNGTAALHLALVTLGVCEDDEVICPDISFVATAASIAYTRADIVFLDVEEGTLGLSAEAVREYIVNETENVGGVRRNKSTGKRLKAIMGMHNVGFPLDVTELCSICEEYQLDFVEDAAEALGSTFEGKSCGTFGAIGVYSFNGNKIVTTGGGGALLTSDKRLYERALHLSTTAKQPHPTNYIHTDIGYNYRMPNLNAALGVAQLESLPTLLSIKKMQAENAYQLLNQENCEILRPKFGETNHWFIPVKVPADAAVSIMTSLNASGVMCRPLWSQISKMKPYANYRAFENPVSEILSKQVLCLPNAIAEKHIAKL